MELESVDQGDGRDTSTDPKPGQEKSLVGGFLDTTPQTREAAEQKRRTAALRIGSLAGAAHHAAGDLEEQFPQTARYMHDAAAGLEHVSSILRDPSLDEVAIFLGNLARKQPAATMAAVVLIGIGLAWLLKTSTEAAADATIDYPEGVGPTGVGQGGAHGYGRS